MNIKHSLKWGGQIKGKTAREVELTVPASDAILLLDQYRTKPITFVLMILVQATASIGGEKPSRDDAETFWRSVKYSDAKHALIELVKPNWPEESGGIEHPAICLKGHVSEVKVRLGDFAVNPEAKREFSCSFPKWEIEPDKAITRITGEIATLGQEEAMQSFIEDEKSSEALLRRIAMTCKCPELPGFQLSFAHVMKMPAPVRRAITRAMNDVGELVDLTIHTTCSQCPLPSEGMLNIVNFL